MSGRNPSKLEGADDHAKLNDLCTRTYKEQTIWFMNAFWEPICQENAERFWQYKHKMDELDLQDHEMGSGLDEMKAHVFLEHFKETQTVREMRTNLRESGAIGEKERPKVVPMIHFLLFRYKVDWHELVNAPQGDNSEEINECARLLQSAQDACKEAERTANAAAAALRESVAAEHAARQREDQAKADAQQAQADEAQAQADEAAAKQREEQAKQREQQAKADAEASAQREQQAHADAEAAKAREGEAEAAQRELEAALAELKAQEDAYNNKTKELEQKSETGGVVSRNKAKNELAQHLGEDPLPLRRAKITQEAAVKKADRATQAAAEATAAAKASASAATEARQAAEQSAQAASQARQVASEARQAAEASARQAEAARAAADESARQAEQARLQAQQARERSEQAKAAADAALQDAKNKMIAAEQALQEAKSKPGTSFGAIWYMERELEEAKRYMPESKGGIRRK